MSTHKSNPATEPRTEAGRALYDVAEHMEWTNGMAIGNRYMVDTILAIEAEAAQQTNIEWNAAEGKVWHYDHEAEAAQGAAPLDRIMALRGTLARIADGRGPAPQMAKAALDADDPLDDADYRSEGAAPLDASDPIAQAKFSLHRLARTTEDAQYVNRIVSGLAARLSEGAAPRAEGPRDEWAVKWAAFVEAVTDLLPDSASRNIIIDRAHDAATAAEALGILRAAPRAEGLDEAVRRFLDTAFPNNGEGRTDRLVWQVPEAAFGSLREAVELAAPRAEGLDVDSREAIEAAAENSHNRDWNADQQGGHRHEDWRECQQWPCNILARLSRPSDEREGATDDR